MQYTVLLAAALALTAFARHIAADPGAPQGKQEQGGQDQHGDMQMPATEADLVAMLLDHHDAAIKMSESEVKRGGREEVKKLAAKIKDAQSKEKQDLARINKELGGKGKGVSGEQKQKMQKQQEELDAASGEKADALFLHHMTEHHKQGVMMLEGSRDKVKHAELSKMVEKMIKDQKSEIEQMHKMQEAHEH